MTQAVSDVTSATVNYTSAATGTELTSAANATIGKLETALASVNKVRSGLGAAANRLGHVYNNLANVSTNTKAATGMIMDVDFATESANMTSKQMLMQASSAMLKQSNSMSSMVMSLLQ
jgi:flagellin